MISVSNVTKHFDEVHALSDVTLDIAEGEFVTIVGPSGCGKSTLLRVIAGLVSSHGSVSSPANGAFVFQDAALLPWRTVQKNVELLMELESVPKPERAGKARSALSQVGLTGFEKSYPHQLSGGMKMRLSLARSLVLSPEYLLLDEPLSNVDAKVRDQLRRELVEMQREINFSAIYVTHDQIEAMELADRIAVMELGKIVQLGPPKEIYERPSTRYVANFIGTVNELSGTVKGISAGGLMIVATELGDLEVPTAEGTTTGSEVAITFRPERCSISSHQVEGSLSWKGTVNTSSFFGSHTEHHIKMTESISFLVWQAESTQLSHNDDVWVTIDLANLRTLPIESDEVSDASH